jgi:hypothetical protein
LLKHSKKGIRQLDKNTVFRMEMSARTRRMANCMEQQIQEEFPLNFVQSFALAVTDLM